MSTKITRRHLLCRTAPALALVPIGLTLAGCPEFNTAVTKTVAVIDSVTPQVIAYVSAIGKIATLVLPVVQDLTGLGAEAGNIIGTAETVLSDIATVGGAIATATGPGAVGLVARIGAGLGTLGPLLAGIKGLPTVVGDFLTNAVALLPAIEQGVGIITAPKPAQHRFARMAATISPERAYQNLLAMGAGR